jgi:ArsR family transcriptional regulator
MELDTEWLKALAEPNRYRIVQLLSEQGREVTCAEVSESLDLSRALISHHMKVLAGAGLVNQHKEGPYCYNSLRKENMTKKVEAVLAISR